MGADPKNTTYFVAGNPLPPDSPSYVSRSADAELFKLVAEAKPCYILAPTQMGKSSLMIRTAWRLQQQQTQVATICLSEIKANAGPDQWFLGLANQLKAHLKLELNVEAWWAERSALKVTQRLVNFLHQVVLAQLNEPVVIFIDEIEAMLNLKFAPDFWATLRQVYEARTSDPVYQRLTFVLLGAALPGDLIKDPKHSPFEVAQKVELNDFSQQEMHTLQAGLEETYPDEATAILARIYYWAGGQPYLTQRLCLAADEVGGSQLNLQASSLVNQLVEKLFLTTTHEPDANLILVRDSLAHSPQRRRLLALYRQVYEGQALVKDGTLLDQNRLKLIGLIRTEKGNLKVRNMIYRQFFNLDWLKANNPSVKLIRYIAVGLIVLALTIAIAMGFAIYKQFQNVVAAQAQPLFDSFDGSTDPTVRLTSLAGLINLPGYQEDAYRRFFELSPADQLALFEQADPEISGPDLVTVVEALYTSPVLKNDQAHNALLQAMDQPLKQLVDDPSAPGAVSLDLEITQWLNGRNAYNQQQYRDAVSAYNLAIDLNDENPGIFFDRALAYAALDAAPEALSDLDMALKLNPAWQAGVQQALIGNSSLYNGLWSDPNSPAELVDLVPTPTNTPIATNTPSPTYTPSPTGTPTTRPTTSTPTTTPTFTPAPIVATPTTAAGSTAPTAVIASAPPTGAFTLVEPLAIDEPSYGPTTFQWQWSGALPADYGFEVRVWKEGASPAGVHNAVLDNQNGVIKNLGNNTYQLQTDITNAAGIKATSGEYFWSVALVRISPKYKDMGLQAPPARIRFAAPGGSGGGSDGDGGGGGGGGPQID